MPGKKIPKEAEKFVSLKDVEEAKKQYDLKDVDAYLVAQGIDPFYEGRPKITGPAGRATGQGLKKKTVNKKKGSSVNESGNYTKSGMRKKLFQSIKSGGKGGNPGQWSARKAQMLAKKYKEKGGGYKS